MFWEVVMMKRRGLFVCLVCCVAYIHEPKQLFYGTCGTERIVILIYEAGSVTHSGLQIETSFQTCFCRQMLSSISGENFGLFLQLQLLIPQFLPYFSEPWSFFQSGMKLLELHPPESERTQVT